MSGLAKKGDRAEVIGGQNQQMIGRVVEVLSDPIYGAFCDVFTGQTVKAQANRVAFDMADLTPEFYSGHLNRRYIRTEYLKVLK